MICMKKLRFSRHLRAKVGPQGPPVSARAQPWLPQQYIAGTQLYLFIHLNVIFAKRPGSLTEQSPLQGPEKKKRKLVIQLTKMTIL